MKDLGIDFGLLIAYLAPGALAIWGLALWIPDLMGLVTIANQEKGGALAISVLLVASLIVGMLISVVRASVLDKTFVKNMDWLPLSSGTAFAQVVSESAEPDYSVLCNQGNLEAYLEAKSSNKRPFQFYGNTMISLLIFSVSYITQRVLEFGWQLADTVYALTILISCFFLYLASRNSYQKLVRAITAINATSKT